jgi:hypothetical protein
MVRSGQEACEGVLAQVERISRRLANFDAQIDALRRFAAGEF